MSEVFHDIAAPHYGCSVAHSNSRLSLTPNTQLVVAVPASLMNYDLQRLLRDVRLLCVDEADFLLTGSEKKATWQLLDTLRDLRHRDRRSKTLPDQTSGTAWQVVVTAATLPQGGPQTAGSLLARWLPRDTCYITTDHTHQTVTTSHHTFTHITAETLLTSRKATPTSCDTLKELKLGQLEKDLTDLHDNQSRVLVFTNTLSSAEMVYQHLTAVGVATTPPWWTGHVGRLHGHMGTEDRAEMVKQFKEGQVRVLVCTDLLSRGMDLPGVATIIQFDFPGNSAHYLHRAGRTARAGKEGKGESTIKCDACRGHCLPLPTVISYTTESDRDLAREVERVLADRSRSFQEIFSRNKMLRRKIKSRKTQQLNREHCM